MLTFDLGCRFLEENLMPTSKLLYPASHLKGNQNKNSLIIQFILSEIIEAFAEMEKVEGILSEIKLNEQRCFTRGDRYRLNSLTTSLGILAGQSQNSMRIFTWNLNDGILTKLKNYCTYFAHKLAARDPDAASLQRNADRAWVNCLEALDQMKTLNELTKDEEPDLTNIKAVLEKIYNRLRRLTRITASLIPRYRLDENVLLFLLNNREQLDKIFEVGFVVKLFHKMFPRGLDKAEQLLAKKYAARGFHHLIPLISEKISSLDNALV